MLIIKLIILQYNIINPQPEITDICIVEETKSDGLKREIVNL